MRKLSSTHEQPVLIVEDDADTRDAMASLLRMEGYSVEGAEDGEAALEKIHGGVTPCLILLDLMMPEVDGHEFRRRQLAEPEIANVPVIVYSALRDVGILATRMGAVAALRKPFDPAQLLAVVREHC